MMKKILFMAFAACMMLASCGNTKDAKNDGAVEEAVAMEIVEKNCTDCDSCGSCVENDSIVTRGGNPSAGFGRCSECKCSAFKGRGNVCDNCGHAYKSHY